MTYDTPEVPLEGLVTVRRTMQVIELLADAPDGLSLSEIARELDAAKSITLRITSTLEDLGYIYRDPDNLRYYSSYKISNIGMRLLVNARLLNQCKPILKKLAEQTGELVLFSVLDRGSPRWVISVGGAGRGPQGSNTNTSASSRHRLQVDPSSNLEPHSSSTGKAWLATLPDAEVARVLKGRMRPITPQTITSLKVMMAELKTIRSTGVSLSNGENEEGVVSVATAIREGGEMGRYVGFVSITAPLVRAGPPEIDRYRTLVVRASQALGKVWPSPETEEFSEGLRTGEGIVIL